MKTNEPLSYTETEIRSYLPTGWYLTRDAANPAGSWDPKKRVWQLCVRDGVDFDWPVEVTSEDARAHGRLEALRRAMDTVYRERLG